ncbi:M56 family metallopeptidase [Sediminicola luteus]|uniref:Peptidase M56 domain-containing protein n=1 Tax=Sediminicola luteus TaxID=319238 RepID=A0A2A4GFF5_9FLAO|nr:M56 family metallopeptidase [Sediminicola luteus]PCE66710.1 hypothetical protein B7P33_05310 [Sediminicola luteus]
MWPYLFKSILILGILLALYKVWLAQEQMHRLKRWYLLLSLPLSFGIPALVFTDVVWLAPATETILPISTQILEAETSINIWEYLPFAVLIIYLTGCLVFGIRFIRNLSQIRHRIRLNPKENKGNYVNVYHGEPLAPHTFLQYLFFNRAQWKHAQIPAEVLLHEEAHAQQWHSIDIIVLELFQILFWFHPLLTLLKKEVKLNHEFLADAAVLSQGTSPTDYQKTILGFATQQPISPMASAMDYSFIKKRFNIMKKTTSTPVKWVKSLSILPLLCLLVYSFAERETVYQTLPQEGATTQMVKEYDRWAKKMNASDNKVIRKKELDRMEHIYALMTPAQKKNAEPFPELPPPPPPVTPVRVTEMVPPPPKVKEVPNPAHIGKEVKVGQRYPAGSIPPPPPPKVSLVENLQHTAPADVPPPPKSPLVYIDEMAQKKAQFQHNGKAITVDQAKALLQHPPTNSIALQTSDNANGTITVNIDTKGETHIPPPPPPKTDKAKPVKKTKAPKEAKFPKVEKQAKAEKNTKVIKKAKTEKPTKTPLRVIPSEAATESFPVYIKELSEVSGTSPGDGKITFQETEFYLDGKAISAKEALSFANEHNSIDHIKSNSVVLSSDGSQAKFKVHLSDNPNRTEGIPPSPKPKSPTEHIEEMAKKGATFNYNGKNIQAQEAKHLVRTNPRLSVLTERIGNSDYVVTLSKKAVVVQID